MTVALVAVVDAPLDASQDEQVLDQPVETLGLGRDVGYELAGHLAGEPLAPPQEDPAAQADAAPIVTAVTRVNGGIACDSGDAGYSPDNTVPWYQGMLDAPDSPDLESRLTTGAASNGYTLEANSHDKAGASTYLVGYNGQRHMEVRIFRGKKAVFAYCNSGEKKRLAPGSALIEVDIAYPDRVDRG